MANEIIFAFLLGFLASATVAFLFEYGSRPKLRTLLDDSDRAQGKSNDNPPHEFYHLKVRNLQARCPLLNRRPAWSCKATLEVFNTDRSRAIQDSIQARWTSQPEPLSPHLKDGQVVNLLDPAKLVIARKVDVHQHEEQQLSAAIKFEGESDCHIFSNESYLFRKWQNPAWRLRNGTYRLRVTLYYERGRTEEDFELLNSGPSRNDFHLRHYSNSRESLPEKLRDLPRRIGILL